MLFAITFKCGNVEYREFDCEVDAWVEFPTAVEIECVGMDEGDEDASYGWDECEALDGDAESALASAGWGTDEDYGQYDDWACQYDE